MLLNGDDGSPRAADLVSRWGPVRGVCAGRLAAAAGGTGLPPGRGVPSAGPPSPRCLWAAATSSHTQRRRSAETAVSVSLRLFR